MAKLRAIDLIHNPDRRMEALRERAKAGKCIYCGQKKAIQAEGFTCPFNLWPPECAEWIRRTRASKPSRPAASYIHDACRVFGLAALVALVALLTHVIGILVAW